MTSRKYPTLEELYPPERQHRLPDDLRTDARGERLRYRYTSPFGSAQTVDFKPIYSLLPPPGSGAYITVEELCWRLSYNPTQAIGGVAVTLIGGSLLIFRRTKQKDIVYSSTKLALIYGLASALVTKWPLPGCVVGMFVGGYGCTQGLLMSSQAPRLQAPFFYLRKYFIVGSGIYVFGKCLWAIPHIGKHERFLKKVQEYQRIQKEMEEYSAQVLKQAAEFDDRRFIQPLLPPAKSSSTFTTSDTRK